MAQEKVDSPEKIYETLTNDATFMQLVGKRIFKANNTELDAISICTPGAQLPGVKSISGLEVVIHDITKLERYQYITNDCDIKVTWKVFLLAWPGSNGSTMNDAAIRILQLFSKAYTIEVMPIDNNIGAIAQILVMIPSDSVMLV